MTLHTLVSYCKSAVRILACLVAILFVAVSTRHAVQALAWGLLVAEILGLIEELPGMYKGTDTGDEDKPSPKPSRFDGARRVSGRRYMPRPAATMD